MDIDGVLAQFNKSFYRELCAAEPREIDPKWDEAWLTKWDWPEVFGFSRETQSRVWARIRADFAFWSDLEAYPGAAGVIDTLSRLSLVHPVYFVTSRPATPQVRIATAAWLYQFHSQLPIVMVNKPDAKVHMARAVGAELIIDDRPETIEACAKVVPHKWLISRPWNTGRAPLDCRVIAPDTLNDALKEFEKWPMLMIPVRA